LRGFQEFLTELKRRRVFRALLAWGVLSFAVLQVYEPVMHGLHLPEWTLSFVVVVLGLGFPVTAALSWLFDIKATGIERTAPTEGAGAPSPGLGRLRLPVLLAAVGVAAAAPGLLYYFVWPGAWRRAAESAGARASPSIAVLPFVNLSSDKEQEYFSDGVAEEILNALAQVEGLRVTGRTSSFAMKGKNEDLRTIARQLNVGHLLEGSVRKAGSRVRITAQLIEAAAGTHLWSQEFDGDLGDTFAVQEKIANAVVAALKLKLLPTAHRDVQQANGEAHDLYLLGLTSIAKGSGDGYGRAVAALRKAVGVDPGYAQAWAALASALFWAADQGGGGFDPKVDWPQAQAAAEKAIALAPDLSDGYEARALLRQNFLMDWEGARADLERARALKPGTPSLLELYAYLLSTLGRMQEAIPLLKQAGQLDPLSAEVQTSLAIAYLGMGQLPLAQEAASHALDLAPEHARAARTLGFALLLQNRPEDARAAFHRSTNALFRTMGDAMVDHSLGRAAESQRALDSILALPTVLRGSYQVAQVYAWRGETEKAFEWLGHALDAHDPGLTHLKRDPVMRGLRPDPRYPALLRRLNLPES